MKIELLGKVLQAPAGAKIGDWVAIPMVRADVQAGLAATPEAASARCQQKLLAAKIITVQVQK
jgi:hypothetical protein